MTTYLTLKLRLYMYSTCKYVYKGYIHISRKILTIITAQRTSTSIRLLVISSEARKHVNPSTIQDTQLQNTNEASLGFPIVEYS
jgi:hypothetical protein